MKLVVVVSTLDFKYRLGCTPAWWQLLKALHENGNELVVIPYLGRAIETAWWRTYDNAWRMPGEIFYHLSKKVIVNGGRSLLREDVVRRATRMLTWPVWLRHLRRILAKEKNVDALIFFNVPLNQIMGIPSALRNEFGISTMFYDGDMPTILPEHISNRGFMFNYYRGADLAEYDAFLVNSEGVMRGLEMAGARNVKPLHYGADPNLFSPLRVVKEYDIAFYGYGSQAREKWMTRMIANPSVSSSHRYVVGGNGFGINLGRANTVGDVPMNAFNAFCSKSKINLNITRESHTRTFASSTARPFELASMGCCIVSCPYSGLDKWFEPGREIVLLKEEDNPSEIYSSLLECDELLTQYGTAARDRVLREHTYSDRANQLEAYIRGLG